MTRIVDNQLHDVEIETGRSHPAQKPYISPWGVPPRSNEKKGRKRR